MKALGQKYHRINNHVSGLPEIKYFTMHQIMLHGGGDLETTAEFLVDKWNNAGYEYTYAVIYPEIPCPPVLYLREQGSYGDIPPVLHLYNTDSGYYLTPWDVNQYGTQGDVINKYFNPSFNPPVGEHPYKTYQSKQDAVIAANNAGYHVEDRAK